MILNELFNRFNFTVTESTPLDVEVAVDPEAALEALRSVRVCDPACGSGAYLLGMLLDLRASLFATRSLDPISTYERKLEIIQRNLYGVDIDSFAGNIARLRLWLSLVVDFEGEDEHKPPPLPNLDFKIETGDSLAAPDPSGGMLAFISSNKSFRANYGKKLRKLLADTCHVTSIVDFGDLPVFQSATPSPPWCRSAWMLRAWAVRSGRRR